MYTPCGNIPLTPTHNPDMWQGKGRGDERESMFVR